MALVCQDHRPSHPYIAGTEHIGFPQLHEGGGAGGARGGVTVTTLISKGRQKSRFTAINGHDVTFSNGNQNHTTQHMKCKAELVWAADEV